MVDGTRRRTSVGGHGTALRRWHCSPCPCACWESEKFPDGVKYRLHYGTEGGETLLRYDNSHGVHERHTDEGLDDDYEFPGYGAVQQRFWDEVQQVRD
ncbi:toxin-antitoxin system TumE family protein [Haloarcula halophila]|uniref:toxin-antitoxin system TumE family protein n=1 Tax=Halomicroarcula sp. GCM10025335 TaxID=3252668 RepID=UPI003609E78B